MNLDIDVGNSLCKWRLIDEAAKLDSGSSSLDDLLSEQRFGGRGIHRVRISSVREDSVNDALAKWVNSWHASRAEFASCRPSHLGLTIAYQEPALLGVDRWLSMLVLWTRFKRAFWVVQCGTAITADVVDANGRHRGGYIVPGLAMMRSSLLGSTDRVRFDERNGHGSAASPGRDTGSAVRNGACLAAAAFIDRVDDISKALCGDVSGFVTGGDAGIVMAEVGAAAVIVDGLVLDGLAIALP